MVDTCQDQDHASPGFKERIVQIVGFPLQVSLKNFSLDHLCRGAGDILLLLCLESGVVLCVSLLDCT